MICHSRGACISLVVIGIASAGIWGCTDSDQTPSVQDEDEAVPGGHQSTDASAVEEEPAFNDFALAGDDTLPGIDSALVAEVQTASDDISVIVNKMFRSIAEGKFEMLYESSTEPRFREAVSLEEFSTLCERVQSRLGALRTKQSSRFDLNPVEGSLLASATYQAQFEHGNGTIFVVFGKVEEDWLLLRLNVNAPQLLDDPATFQQPTELYVENSEPVLPGTMVDLLDTSAEPATVVIENVRVLNVRWKVDDPSMPLDAPAKGFVTIGLTREEAAAVRSSRTLAIRPHEQ